MLAQDKMSLTLTVQNQTVMLQLNVIIWVTWWCLEKSHKYVSYVINNNNIWKHMGQIEVSKCVP